MKSSELEVRQNDHQLGAAYKQNVKQFLIFHNHELMTYFSSHIVVSHCVLNWRTSLDHTNYLNSVTVNVVSGFGLIRVPSTPGCTRCQRSERAHGEIRRKGQLVLFSAKNNITCHLRVNNIPLTAMLHHCVAITTSMFSFPLLFLGLLGTWWAPRSSWRKGNLENVMFCFNWLIDWFICWYICC